EIRPQRVALTPVAGIGCEVVQLVWIVAQTEQRLSAAVLEPGVFPVFGSGREKTVGGMAQLDALRLAGTDGVRGEGDEAAPRQAGQLCRLGLARQRTAPQRRSSVYPQPEHR